MPSPAADFIARRMAACWQLIKSDFFNAPQDLAIDPRSNRVYLITPNYPCLYMSTDGGASMSSVMTLPTAVTSAWQIAVSQSGTTLYVTSGMRVFIRRIAQIPGRSEPPWARIRAPVCSAVDRSHGLEHLYASATTSATDAGIFATDDGAMTWQLLESGNESTACRRLRHQRGKLSEVGRRATMGCGSATTRESLGAMF